MDRFEIYVNSLNSKLKESLKYYTSDNFSEFNKKIRSNIMQSPGSSEHYYNILDIFEGGPTVNDNITVYRGMKKKFKELENSGFISTSLSKDVAKSFANSHGCCLYVISLTPGNYTILPLASVSQFPQEDEILLPPGGLTIQKISPYTDNREGIDIIYCTYKPENVIETTLQELSSDKDVIEMAKINLSYDAWLKRVISMGIDEELELYDFEDEDTPDELMKLMETLPFYDDIPDEIVEKIIQFFINCSGVITQSS